MKKGSKMTRRFPIICPICGTKKILAVPWGKYCSKNCAMISWADRRRAELKARVA